MRPKNEKLKPAPLAQNENGQVGPLTGEVSAPSNIALVKYWGKKDNQVPCNPSVSLTLSQCLTHMSYSAEGADLGKSQLVSEFSFEGQLNLDFKKNLEKRLERLNTDYPSVLNRLKELGGVSLSSMNTFPHSAGIASSASSMAAISEVLGKVCDIKDRSQISALARLLSGSACRSVYPGGVLWGELEVENATLGSWDYAVPVPTHARFENLQNWIVVVDQRPKPVSSSQGHLEMVQNPYGEKRFELATQRCLKVVKALDVGDFETVASITEREAYELQAMMMLGRTPYILWTEKTWDVINQLKDYRERTGVPLFFTTDAGPNVHVFFDGNLDSEKLERDFFKTLNAIDVIKDKVQPGGGRDDK